MGSSITGSSPSATTSRKGIAELATNAEAQAGTDTEKVITPDALAAAIVASPDQSWSNVLGSRSSGVTYTNNTGQPIVVMVQVGTTSSFSAYDVELGGNLVGDLQQLAANTFYARLETFIVPDGDTYEITVGTGNIEKWWELR